MKVWLGLVMENMREIVREFSVFQEKSLQPPQYSDIDLSFMLIKHCTSYSFLAISHLLYQTLWKGGLWGACN